MPVDRLVHHVQPHDLSHIGDKAAEHPLLLTNCTLIPNGTSTSIACTPIEATALPQPDYELNERELMYLCPVLLHELATSSGGCIAPEVLADIDKFEAQQKDDILYGKFGYCDRREIMCNSVSSLASFKLDLACLNNYKYVLMCA